MKPQEIEARLEELGRRDEQVAEAARHVFAVHDAVVVETECSDCGTHAVMVCRDCADDPVGEESLDLECPHAAALVAGLGSGQVIT